MFEHDRPVNFGFGYCMPALLTMHGPESIHKSDIAFRLMELACAVGNPGVAKMLETDPAVDVPPMVYPMVNSLREGLRGRGPRCGKVGSSHRSISIRRAKGAWSPRGIPMGLRGLAFPKPRTRGDAAMDTLVRARIAAARHLGDRGYSAEAETVRDGRGDDFAEVRIALHILAAADERLTHLEDALAMHAAASFWPMTALAGPQQNSTTETSRVMR